MTRSTTFVLAESCDSDEADAAFVSPCGSFGEERAVAAAGVGVLPPADAAMAAAAVRNSS